MSHSRQTVPRISLEDLRNHGQEERIDRVWDRLASGLAAEQTLPAYRRRPARWQRPLALVMAFAVGVCAGHWLTRASRHSPAISLTAASDKSVPEVLAAGQSPRHYLLPGGGSLALAPGSIVDTVDQSGDVLTLRLVHGEAQVSTESAGHGARTAALVLEVGEATITTHAGSLRVRHDGETADLEVINGSAAISSPDADVGLRRSHLGPNEKLTVPIRIATAHVEPAQRPSRTALKTVLGHSSEPSGEPRADWRGRCVLGEYEAVLDLLGAQPGGLETALAGAGSPFDLMCISSAARLRGGDAAAAIQALTRVVEEFPDDPQAYIAALNLGTIHHKAGDKEKAAHYFERSRSLSPDNVLTEDALCTRIDTEAQEGHAEAVVRLAEEYRAQYPDGPCTERIDRIVATLHSEEQPSDPSEAAQPRPDPDKSQDPPDGGP